MARVEGGAIVSGSSTEESVELSSPEPPLAGVLRGLVDTRKLVTVCSVDGSTVIGTVIEVSPSGLMAKVENGRDLYVFDITLISVLKIAHDQRSRGE